MILSNIYSIEKYVAEGWIGWDSGLTSIQPCTLYWWKNNNQKWQQIIFKEITFIQIWPSLKILEFFYPISIAVWKHFKYSLLCWFKGCFHFHQIFVHIKDKKMIYMSQIMINSTYCFPVFNPCSRLKIKDTNLIE